MNSGGPLVFLARESSRDCFARVGYWAGPAMLRSSVHGEDGQGRLQTTAAGPQLARCSRWGREERGGHVWKGRQKFLPLAKAGVLPSLGSLLPPQRCRAGPLSPSCHFKHPQLELRECYSSI